jgi:DNA-binding CsgD family transcriptional regulator/PAS domain-containing protein
MPDPISSRVLSELIGSIYDCALDPDLWDGTLSELLDAFSGHNATLSLFDLPRRVAVFKNAGLTPEQLETQKRYAPEIKALMYTFVQHSLDEPHVFSRQLSRGDWETSPLLRTVREQGCIDFITYFPLWAPGHACALTWGRIEGQGVFAEREIALGGLLLPHLRRAVTITKALDARAIDRERIADALDALKCGVVLANQSGAILHANRAAERMMRHRGPLQSFRGVVQAKAAAADHELRTAIALAAKDETALGKTGLAIRLSDDDAPPQFAHVLPLTGGETRTRFEPEAAAGVFVSAPPDEAEGAQAMAAAYRLTPAETRLIESLLAGRGLKDSAAALDIATTTAKTHLEHIFEKTGVNRQAELIRLAMRAASPARPPRPGLIDD